MVMIIGIMLGLTGQAWKMVMKREREKELIFRGSQIKEAIENWYDQNYSVKGLRWRGQPQVLMDLKYLLDNPHVVRGTDSLKYLPQSYGTKLDDKSTKCDPDCPELKIYQDPMTGKKWTIIKGTRDNNGNFTVNPGAPGIIGVASRSDEEPMKTDFRETALENMGPSGVGAALGTITTVAPFAGAGTTTTPPVPGGSATKMTKYSEWEFKAESPQKNDHKKLYRAYHERW
jgi:type II secretory pathway pseudopilin PulG